MAVTFLFSVPLKYISGYYGQSKHLVKDIFVGQVLLQGNSYLWFLLILFMIFIIVYFLEHYRRENQCLILICTFAASFFSVLIPVSIVKNTLYYLFWFYAGYYFERKRDDVNGWLEEKPYALPICGSLFLLIFIIKHCMPDYPGMDVLDVIDRMLGYICALFGCFSIYILSNLLSKTNITKWKSFQVIRRNTLGIYLYSDPWNYLILSVMAGKFGSSVFVTNGGAALLYFCRMIFTFTVALIISEGLKRLKFVKEKGN